MMRRVGVAGSLRPDSYGGAWCAPAAEVVPGGTLLSLTPWSEEGLLAVYVQDIFDTLCKLTNDATRERLWRFLALRGVRA
ncbi:MAG: hypothetical protein DI562_03590 [Stenotrophomonas acidaminiphila]|nr:MAG: hypothetical protein DI562_03590 [Stenotrophomonas acidaminiphila]